MSQARLYLSTNTFMAPVTTIECVNGKWVAKTYQKPDVMRGDVRRGFYRQFGNPLINRQK